MSHRHVRRRLLREPGASYNAGGQRLRDDWRGNRAWSCPGDEEFDDMEGYERQMLAEEGDW